LTAPLQVIALSFSRGAGAEDRILAEVDRLRGRGVLRLLDMLFVAKSQDGSIEQLASVKTRTSVAPGSGRSGGQRQAGGAGASWRPGF
jgi:hypothetical protein